MPYSSPNGKELAVTWLTDLRIKKVLDVGPGSGVYEGLLRPLLPGSHWLAWEPWEPYLESFSLRERYDELWLCDARDQSWAGLELDLVIFGDVLEHMTKEEACKLVDKALNHSKWVFISIPIVYMPQGEADGNPYEVHVKPDWTHEEVLTTFGIHVVESRALAPVGVYLLSKDGE